MRRGTAVLSMLLLVGGATAACGDDDDNNSGSSTSTTRESSSTSSTSGASSTGSEEFCQARSDFNDSIDELKDVNPITDGTQGIENALNDVEDNLQAMRDAASDEARPEIDAFQDSFSDLKNAISNVDDVGISGVADAVRDTVSAADDLKDKLQSIKCD
jgi:hypothetical protein